MVYRCSVESLQRSSTPTMPYQPRERILSIDEVKERLKIKRVQLKIEKKPSKPEKEDELEAILKNLAAPQNQDSSLDEDNNNSIISKVDSINL